MLDGTEVGRLRRGETLELGLAEGHHHLTIRIDWAGSPQTSFSIRDKELVQFTCRPGPATPMLDLGRRGRWITLVRLDR